MAWTTLATDFTVLLRDSGSGGSVSPGWSRNANPAHALSGSASGAYATGNRDDSFLALVRRSGAFASARRSAAAAAWFKLNGSNLHAAGFLLRFRPANPAHGPSDVVASDLTGGDGYALWIDRFGAPVLARGPLLRASAAALWPRNWGAAGPLLGTINGGWLYRVKVFDAPGGVAFEVGQSASAGADAAEDGDWTRVTTFVDASAGRIAEPGLFGAFHYTMSGVNVTNYVDGWQDLPLEE